MGISRRPTPISFTLLTQYSPSITKVTTIKDLCIVLNIRLSAEDSIPGAAKIARWMLFEHISFKSTVSGSTGKTIVFTPFLDVGIKHGCLSVFSFPRLQLLRKFAWIFHLIGGNTQNIAHEVSEVSYALFDVVIPSTENCGLCWR